MHDLLCMLLPSSYFSCYIHNLLNFPYLISFFLYCADTDQSCRQAERRHQCVCVVGSMNEFGTDTVCCLTRGHIA